MRCRSIDPQGIFAVFAAQVNRCCRSSSYRGDKHDEHLEENRVLQAVLLSGRPKPCGFVVRADVNMSALRANGCDGFTGRLLMSTCRIQVSEHFRALRLRGATADFGGGALLTFLGSSPTVSTVMNRSMVLMVNRSLKPARKATRKPSSGFLTSAFVEPTWAVTTPT
jgi:hypothetical protein